MKKTAKPDLSIYRKKAQEWLKKRPLKDVSQFSKAKAAKLIYELEIHQAKLELQNEKLLQARTAARDVAELYAELYDFAPSGYFTLSKEGHIIRLNISGSQMLGKERIELINSRFDQYISDETKPVFNIFLDKVLRSKTKETCEVALSVNSNLPVEVQLTGIVSGNGKNCHVTTVDTFNIKKIAELNKMLLYSMPHPAMYIRRKDRVVLATNKIASDMGVKIGGYCWRDFGRTDYISQKDKGIADNYPEEVPAEFGIKCSFCQGDKCFSDAPEQNNPDLHAFGMIWDAYWIKVSDEVFLHYLVNITERKQAEIELQLKNEELHKINAEKDKFFSIIAHDLRSPFNGFLGLTELMADGLTHMTLEEIQKTAVLMRNSATNLFRLLGNLLEWSRLQRGLATFTPTPLLLLPKISEIMVLVLDTANKKEITVNYELPEDLVVFADVNMFEVIIRNLVTNAVKFTPKGGNITVSSQFFPDKSVEIAIRDTGIGMNKNMMDNLFRLDVNTNRKGTDGEYSTGLGLIICKDLVEKHGGKLWAESEDGKGSTFRFSLPAN
jgi:signal transduction histidine kinase